MQYSTGVVRERDLAKKRPDIFQLHVLISLPHNIGDPREPAAVAGRDVSSGCARCSIRIKCCGACFCPALQLQRRTH